MNYYAFYKTVMPDRVLLQQIIRVMRITAFLILITLVQVSASTFAQRITMQQKDATLKDVFEQIKHQTGYDVVCKSNQLKQSKTIQVNFVNQDVRSVLDQILPEQNLDYVLNGRTFVIKARNKQNILTKEENTLMEQKVYGSVDIRGRVIDSEGRPIPGASVKVKGTTKAVITDTDGSFQLKGIADGSLLEISFIGYTSVEIKASKDLGNIELKQSDAKLDELVVVGYGTQKKVNLTGAVASVSGAVLTKRPVASAAAMLEGLLPGVGVVQSKGQPGEGNVSIQIRGKGTFSGAGENPLILIDGIPGNMESLNPSSIESVTVLKDAASAAIYGSRAANGVILVTTKDGKGGDGKVRVTYDFNYGIHSPTKMLDMVTNSADYMRAWNTRIRNANYGVDIPTRQYPQTEIDKYANATDRILYPNFNWIDYMIKPAPTTMHNLSVSGGQQTHYNLALGYIDEKGTMSPYRYRRINMQVNVVSEVSKKFKVGATALLKNGITNSTNSNGGGDANQFLTILAQPPTIMPTLPDGSGRYSWRSHPFEENNWNPLLLANEQPQVDKNYTANAQVWSDWEILKGLHWNVKAASNVIINKGSVFQKPMLTFSYLDPSIPGYTNPIASLSKSDNYDVYTNLYSYLTYDKKIGLHNFNLMAGYNNEKDNYEFMNAYRSNFASTTTPELNAGSQTGQTNGGSSSAWAIESYFGRFSYNFNGKYLIETNLRYDGTSRLSSANRWGSFPSFSAAWRLSEESFMQSTRSWLSNAKIRASWGRLGNQNIGTYPYQALLTYAGVYPFDNASLTQGVAQTALNNEDIKWETTTSSNLGLDLTLFNKLSLSVDVYKKYTKDILRGAQVTGIVGLGAPTINSGAMQNTGVDFEMQYTDKVESGPFKDLKLNAKVILSAFKNKLVKFGVRQDNGSNVYEEGRPWGTFYLLQSDGIFQTAEEVANSPKQFGENTKPGMMKWKDVSGPDGKPDGKIDNNDRVLMEDGVFPKFTYGFNLNLEWKNFDVYGFFQGVAGSKVLLNGGSNSWGIVPFSQGSAPTKEQLAEAWTPENHSNAFPMLGDPVSFNHPSTLLLRDNSYFRLKAIQIGYSLPNKWVGKLGLQGVRIYFAGDNLFTFTPYGGLDPERSGSGTYVSYPQNRVISFGLSAKF